VDEGISGARETRPALDRLVADVKRRKVDVVVCWSLDRMGPSLRHLITLLDDFQSLDVSFVSLKESIDCTGPSGRLQIQILAAPAEFQRQRLRERVLAGFARAKAHGVHLKRPSRHIRELDLARVAHLSIREAAAQLRVSRSVRRRARIRREQSVTSA
jgi:DNA invertase Pin-like site-specific DNA recombinase